MLSPAGVTVAEHLRAIGCELDRLSAMVYIDDRLIPRAEWEWVAPRAGQARRAGDSAGRGRRRRQSILGIVAMIGLVVATLYIGGGALAGVLPQMASDWTSSFMGELHQELEPLTCVDPASAESAPSFQPHLEFTHRV